MSAVHGERLIKQLVRGDVAEDDEETLGHDLGAGLADSIVEPRHQLSRVLRRLSREVVTGTDSRFCMLQRTIVFLTTAAVSDEDISAYHAFFRMDPDDPFDLEEIDQMEREARRFSGVRLDVLTERLESQMRQFRIVDSISSKDMHSVLSQVEEHRTGEGSIITWSSLLELVSFGRADDAGSARIASQRKDRRRLLQAIRQKFDFSSSRFSDIAEYSADMSADVVSRSRMHRWIRYNLRWDLTKPEMMHLLKEIFSLGSSGSAETDLQPSASIDESIFRAFLVGSSKRNPRSTVDDVIVDIQVGSDPPPGENFYERIKADGEAEECNLSMSVFDRKPTFIWFLRRKGIDGIGLDRESGGAGPGMARLSPIVDIRLESESVSSDLVAAGYTCCSTTAYAFQQQRATARAHDLDNSTIKLRVNSVDRHRYLWIRRATNRMEARDQAIVDLRFTAGRMSVMKDRMHSPPAGPGDWEEVMGRQRRSMPLKRWAINSVLRTDDLKMWCLRGERASSSARQDRVALCLSSWRRNEGVFARELEKSVRLNLRQRNGKAMEKLTEVSDFPSVFNRHLLPGYRRMGRTGFAELLSSAGLYMAPRERELLFRRLCREASAPGIERQDFVSFVSKTEFELEESAFHLKQVLRRLHRISASQPRQKRLNVRRLKTLLEQACWSSEDGSGLRGITIDLFGFMLRCIGEFLSEAEQVRLILRFDPSFSGSVNIDKLIEFVASERDAPTERAERVLLAAQTLAEMVQECDAPTGDTKTAQAWKDLGDRRRLRTSTMRPMLSSMICTMGIVANMPDRQLEPEDLALAVERRAAHAVGVRGALRLSPYESRQLVMLIAPRNREAPGLVSLEHWRNFFVTSKNGASTRISPRTLGGLLDTLNRPEFLGTVVNAYRKWFNSEDGAEAEDLRSDFVKLRDTKIRAILGDDSVAGPHQYLDPTIGVEAFSKLPWPYRENTEGDRPFRNASEVALVALHIGADDIRDGNVDVFDEMHCVRVATFIEGICRIIHGDIEPQEEARLVRINEDASPLALVCDDLRSEIRTGAVEGRASADYAGWAIGALIEFKIATEVEAQPWLEGKKATGIPMNKFTDLLARYNDAFGWGLESAIVASWAKDWDANRDGFVRTSDIAKFVDGTSRAAKEDIGPRAGQQAGEVAARPVAVLSLGDSQAEALVSAVVQQLAPKNSLLEGMRVLHQSFHHPLVDAYPPKGYTTLSGFRRALATAGVTVDPTELAAGLGLFSEKGRIDYELFIRCARRAWFIGEELQGRDGGAAYLGPKLEALRGALRRAAEQDVAFPRGGKLFARLDADRDGKLSIVDLETGFQTYKIKHTLSARDFNTIFQYFDDDLERLVDVEEFGTFILEGLLTRPLPRETGAKRDLLDAGEDSDDPDEDWAELTLAKSRNPKRDPFRDIREAINDRWGTTRDRAALANTLRSKDPRGDGRIPEKTFLRFLRRTELLSDLSRRQLQDLLHEMDPSNSHILNYDPFINKAILAPGMSKEDLAHTGTMAGTRKASDTLRDSQADSEDPRPALQHILERVSRAHSRGRGFHLAFSDPDSLGLVSRDSARRTLEKSFGCDLVEAEYNAVFAQLPKRRDGLIDYQALYDLLLVTTPRNGGEPGAGLPQGQFSKPGPFTPLVTPIAPLHGPTSPRYGVMNTSTVLPPWMTTRPGGGMSGRIGGGGDDWAFGEALGRIRRHLAIGPYAPSAGKTLERAILEAGESNHRHIIAVSRLQYLLQNLGVHLSSAEVHSLASRFAVPGTNAVDYRELSNALDLARQPTSSRTTRESIARQLRDQHRKGLDVRLIFGMFDKRSTGYVTVRDFKEALGQMSIDLTEVDLASLTTVYTHEMNPDLVNYVAFLRAYADGVPPLDLDRSVDQPPRSRYNEASWRQARSFDDEASYQRSTVDHAPVLYTQEPTHSAKRPDAPRGLDPFFGEPASPVHPRYTYTEGGNRSPTRTAAREASMRVWGANVSLENRGKLSRELKRDLDEKGKWMCLYCLYQNPRNTANCEVCGAANPSSQTSAVRVECPRCHHENSEFDQKCGMCGYDLSTPIPSRKKAPAREPEESLWDARDDEYDGLAIDFGKTNTGGAGSAAPMTPNVSRWRD